MDESVADNRRAWRRHAKVRPPILSFTLSFPLCRGLEWPAFVWLLAVAEGNGSFLFALGYCPQQRPLLRSAVCVLAGCLPSVGTSSVALITAGRLPLTLLCDSDAPTLANALDTIAADLAAAAADLDTELGLPGEQPAPESLRADNARLTAEVCARLRRRSPPGSQAFGLTVCDVRVIARHQVERLSAELADLPTTESAGADPSTMFTLLPIEPFLSPRPRLK